MREFRLALFAPVIAVTLFGCGGGKDDTSIVGTGIEDTGEVDPGAPALLESGEAVVCAEPELRTTLGPYFELDAGANWASQVDPSTQYGRGVAVADFSGDGAYDIFIPNLGRDQLYIDQGDGSFIDEAVDRFDTFSQMVTERSQAAYAVDVDDDGDLDLFVANRGNINRVHLNDGSGNFTNANVGMAAQGAASLAATFMDINGDGHLDMFVSAHFLGPSEGWSLEDPGDATPAELYLSNGDGTYRDISHKLPEAALLGYTNAAGLLDIDQDGLVELYVANDFGALTHHNHLYRITPSGNTVVLTDISEETGTEMQMFGMGIAYADLNGDTLPELLLTSWDELILLESTPGAPYYDSAASRGITHEYGLRDVAWGPEFGDLDNDGDEDLYVVYGYLEGGEEDGLANPVEQPDALFVQEEDGSFTQEAEAWGLDNKGVGRGFSFVDLNFDGFLDIITRDLEGPTVITMARCDSSTWLELRLHQPAPNVGAIGARVEAYVDGRVMTRWVVLGANNFSGSSMTDLHFGLGGAEYLDLLVVHWPDGEVSRFEKVDGNRLISITKE
tara:strand:+ start:1112 stop:2791 length:1680 start_codon:yes stop_codon:yes gene_type:complete